MEQTHEGLVDETCDGLRLDVFLAEMLEDGSRSFVKKLIKEGRAALNGKPCKKASRCVTEGDRYALRVPPPPPAEPVPQAIPIAVVHEDADVLVVNKHAGLVVHPAPGHPDGTLVNAVLHHCKDFESPGEDPARPGIVHRLDRDTSGIMVVAKSRRAFLSLAQQAAEHSFERRYLALVRGEFKEDRGRIDAGIGRSLVDRGRMAVTGVHARDAITHVETRERLGVASLVALRLETGRTHQIRVHLRFAGRPVLGDPVYGVTDFRSWNLPAPAKQALDGLVGQALHAGLLGFTHPGTGERMVFEAAPPPDFMAALNALRAHAGAAAAE